MPFIPTLLRLADGDPLVIALARPFLLPPDRDHGPCPLHRRRQPGGHLAVRCNQEHVLHRGDRVVGEERRFEVELAVVEQAGTQHTVRGHAHAAAGRAERLGYRVDETYATGPTWHREEPSGGAGVGRHALERTVRGLDRGPDLASWHETGVVRARFMPGSEIRAAVEA